MNIHKNGRLTSLRREEMAQTGMEGRLSKAHAARTYGVSAKIVARWVERFNAEGRAGTADRSSRPRVMPGMTAPSIAERIVALRRQRFAGSHIAIEVGVSAATVSRVLRRAGLSRLRDLEPAGPVRRYEREHPGEMIHVDIKKLRRFERVGHRITGERTGQSNSRGAGWEFFHVAVDDASRIAFSQILPDERQESAITFLEAALACYASLGGHRQPHHDRQRLVLPLESLRKDLPQPRPQARQDAALYAQDPMARRSASARPRSGNGPVPWPIRPPTTAPHNCRSGCTATIGIVRTAA